MAKPTRPAKAYSYLRFSTQAQSQGDSKRRQTALAEAYAARKGLELDEELTFADCGVSAYRGANLGKDGKLAYFLEVVRSGQVAKGSYLLVENLDRLSRQTARKALRTLEDIIDQGIIVVTLDPEHEYSAAKLDDGENFDLMLALLTMMRGHQESAKKGARVKKAYLERVARAQADKVRTRHRHPGWLRWSAEAKQYELIPERAAVVRQIFKLSAEGVGKESIAERFNREGVPVFGGGKRWYASFIDKTRKNRAVLGEMNPKATPDQPSAVSDESTAAQEGRAERVSLGKIKGYYPAVLSSREFQRVADLVKGSNNPRRGRHAGATVSNVLGGIARCPLCGENMTRVTKGPKGGVPYLVCTKAKTGADCSYHTVNYATLEDAIFQHSGELVAEAPADREKGQKLEQRLKQNEAEQHALIGAIERLTTVAERGKSKDAPASILARLTELEAELNRLNTEAHELNAQRASMAPTVVSQRLRELSLALKEPRDLGKANAALRLVLESVVVNYRSGVLELKWQHGGESGLAYAWPTDGTTRRGPKSRS